MVVQAIVWTGPTIFWTAVAAAGLLTVPYGILESRAWGRLIRIAVPQHRAVVSLGMPELCVYCGARVGGSEQIGVKLGAGVDVQAVSLEAPYCERHLQQTRRNTKVLSRVQIIGVVVAVVGFAVWFFTSGTFDESLDTLGGGSSAGLALIGLALAAGVGGVVPLFLLKLLSPYFFRSLLVTPMSATNTYPSGALGVKLAAAQGSSAVTLWVVNPEARSQIKKGLEASGFEVS